MFELLGSKRFAPLFWCQFFAALNDNFVKTALSLLILYRLGQETGQVLVTLAGVALIAPFFILSAMGGEIADKFDKGVVAERLKFYEIGVAALAAAGFYFESIPVLFLSLAGLGVLAALFGPIKYGVLPAHLSTQELSPGNALVEGATFLAILLGTIAGGLILTGGAEPQVNQALVPIIAAVILALATASWMAARLIPRTGAADPNIIVNRNPWASTVQLIGELRSDRRLMEGAVISGWFWLVGAVMLALLPAIVMGRLGGAPSVYTAALLVFTVSIAVGSILAAMWSSAKPNLALVPLGAVIMATGALGLAWVTNGMVKPALAIDISAVLASTSGLAVMACLALLAVGGGLFIVPAFAAVQSWSPEERRARVIAACNVVSAAMMTAASLVLAALQAAGVPLSVFLVVIGAGSLAVAWIVWTLWPKDILKQLAQVVFQLLRLEVRGLENFPAPGTRAIIAPNHVSLLDAPILHATMPEHTTYAIDTQMSQQWWIKPFLRHVNWQSIDPTRPMGMRELIAAVKGGQQLVIFPEGRLTRTGSLMKVYDGTALIADKADAVVVPVRIEGPERAKGWSYLRPTQIAKSLFPKTILTILPPEKLNLDPALRGKTRRLAAGVALQEIMAAAAVKTAPADRTLFSALVEAGRLYDTGQPIVEDPLGTKLTYRQLVLGSQALGAKLMPLTKAGEAVGVLLPNSAGAAVTFYALQATGRVPAMLNFTAGAKNVLAACHAAGVVTVLTSRVFIEKGRLGDLVAALAEKTQIIYLDDIRVGINLSDKVSAVLQGRDPQVTRNPDDAAVILFTSGSEGLPKGVVLSHRNILSNAYQSLARVDVSAEDKVFNALPMFHSFGLTAGFIMGPLKGVPVHLYPTPLHYRIVPELAYQTNATILFGTDTFLNGYARAAHPYDFARVRYVLAGAEPVRERTRAVYMEKFGIRILEGYGVTECAPVLALNTPFANKLGTVGKPVPLLETRLDPVPGVSDGGRLHVRGPNVMLGYYRHEAPRVLERPRDGWHDTGDIVVIDANGFITIKGRAKRFAKVGGEMVSLAAVEALAADLWPSTMSVVVAEPDAKKGERLVLVTADSKATRAAFQVFAKAKGASDLMVPAEVLVVPAVPLLGSGKPDFVGAAKLLAERRARGQAPDVSPSLAAE